jgi:hypothetical protein
LDINKEISIISLFFIAIEKTNPRMIYNTDHTIGNIQLGGVNEGLFFLNQSVLTLLVVKREEIVAVKATEENPIK